MLNEVYKIFYLYLLRSIYIYLKVLTTTYNIALYCFTRFQLIFSSPKQPKLDSKVLKLVCMSVLLIGQRSDFTSTFYKHNYVEKKYERKK